MGKLVVVDAGPREGWNTAQMLEAAARGAAETGARVEMVRLYDLDFKGCRSCFGCMRKGSEHNGHCVWPDGLKPVLQSIDDADGIIVGSPVYFGDVTSECRAFIERLMFQVLNYEGPAFCDGHLKVGCVYTMNAPEAYAVQIAQRYARLYDMFYRYIGDVSATETLQANHYDRNYLDAGLEVARRERRERHFPLDLLRARELGRMVALA